MQLHDTLRLTAAHRPQRPAVIGAAATLTFAQIDQRSDALAGALQALDVEHGDRVAVCLDNVPEALASIYGILKAGGVFVLVHPAMRSAKLRALLEDCEPRVVIATTAMREALREACAVDEAGAGSVAALPCIWVGPDAPTLGQRDRVWASVMSGSGDRAREVNVGNDDLAAIIYTSGSTGDSKGVMLTHANLVNTTGVIADYLRNTPEDIVSCALPLTFSYGLCQALVGVRVGYTLLLEPSFAFPMDVLRRMREHRVTGWPAVPTMIARLLQMLPNGAIDLSSLRYITNAAAPLPPAHIHDLVRALPHVQFYSMYGQTECTRTTYLDPARLHDKSASVGKAIANCEAFIVDERGRRVEPGVVGELVVRGRNVMRGYWRRPADTGRALRDVDASGQASLCTGDLFRADDEGFLYFVGRNDDVFKCRGEKVSPREVENALCRMPEVAEAAVVGVDDPIDGTAIKAVIVPRTGATINEQRVRMHCRAALEPHLMPRHIEIRESLPKTESGKVRKRDLRTTTA